MVLETGKIKKAQVIELSKIIGDRYLQSIPKPNIIISLLCILSSAFFNYESLNLGYNKFYESA